ncbi:Intraflagellar transport protein 27 [Nowakowskiella sp. JEL0407]|nr:Intraflagellar transport protein 27 [Nowakowskiella sp. JEL0407]
MFHSDGQQYPKTYSMTIQSDIYVKVVKIPETDVTVELFLFDNGGHEVVLEYLPKYCENFGSFVLVFDVTNLDSFKNLPKWLQIIKKVNPGKQDHGVLIGNKIDQGFRRAVTTEQAEEFAKNNSLTYFECSAANNLEVDAPFYFVANSVHQRFEESVEASTKLGEGSTLK